MVLGPITGGEGALKTSGKGGELNIAEFSGLKASIFKESAFKDAVKNFKKALVRPLPSTEGDRGGIGGLKSPLTQGRKGILGTSATGGGELAGKHMS
jgi:hypothetical protein